MLWGLVNWTYVYQAARRTARRHPGEPPDDLAHDIALETVIALGDGLDIRPAVNRAEQRVEARCRPSRGPRWQSVPRVFPGARVSPGDWRALFCWLRRVVANDRQRAVLELTLRGESLARAAELLGVPEGRAKVWRSLALATCRRALEQAR